MAKVTFKVVSNEDKMPEELTDGQLIFVHDRNSGIGKIYLDYGEKRICYTTEQGMNYVGISTTDPSKNNGQGPATINGQELQPRLKDVVVYGKKEYMWRYDSELKKNRWMEIGDEESPDWLKENGDEWNI